MKFTSQALLAAIQKAVDAAAEKGVTVTVVLDEGGFFPGESLHVEITATPTAKGK